MRKPIVVLLMVVALLFGGAVWVALDNAKVQYNLGLIYASGKGVTQDYTEAVKWYRLSAEQGNAQAQFNLGAMYLKGQGVAKDYLESVKWARLAAEQGNAKAQILLGTVFDPFGNESHVNWDFHDHSPSHLFLEDDKGNHLLEIKASDGADSEGANWYRMAADQGNADAQLLLGKFYEKITRFDEKNSSISSEWYRKSANQGNAEAQCLLGENYLMGNGVEKNEDKGVELLLASANQGYVEAEFDLGMAYEDISWSFHNPEEAAKWYLKAAKHVHEYSQRNLGMMLAKGVGVPRDFVSAYMWLNLAAKGGNSLATETRDKLEVLMSPDQLAEAQARASSWHGSTR